MAECVFSALFVSSADSRSPVPTPFASHAFHPVDGYLQSVPYHLFIFLFPIHRLLYLVLFVFVNFWSILVCAHFPMPLTLCSSYDRFMTLI